MNAPFVRVSSLARFYRSDLTFLRKVPKRLFFRSSMNKLRHM